MRTLIALSCAAIGLAAGLVAGVFVTAALGTPPGMMGWVGLLAGLAGGIALARQTYPKRR